MSMPFKPGFYLHSEYRYVWSKLQGGADYVDHGRHVGILRIAYQVY